MAKQSAHVLRFKERDAKTPDKADFVNVSDAAFEVQSWPFYWITRANNAYLQVLEQALKESKLDIPAYRVLMLLHGRRARSITYLADEAIVKLPTMTRIVQRMEREGLVETRPRASDNRVTEVLLTRRGSRARLKAQRAAFGVFAKAFEGVSEEQIGALNSVLSGVISNISAEE